MKKYLLIFFAFLFLNSGLASAFPSPEDIKPVKASKQAIENLLDTFEKAFIEEDIDLLDSIISEDITGQEREYFLSPFEINFATIDCLSFEWNKKDITFGENGVKISAGITQNIEDLGNVTNETQLYDFSFTVNEKVSGNGATVFTLASYEEELNTMLVRNNRIIKDNKLSEIRVFSSDSAGASNILSAKLNLPGSKDWIKLESETEEEIFFVTKGIITLKGLKGFFTTPSKPGEYQAKVIVKTTDGKTTIINHNFKVSDRKMENLSPENSDPFFKASAKDKNGILWFGGREGGKIFRSINEEAPIEVFNLKECLSEKNLPDCSGSEDPLINLLGCTWIEDIAIDSFNKVHAIFYGHDYNENNKLKRIVCGDASFDADKKNLSCGDISLLIYYDVSLYGDTPKWSIDNDYPFYEEGKLPSAFIKALPVDDGSLWLLGSDLGTANFLDSRGKRFDPILTKSGSIKKSIASNTVITATEDKRGDIWFGTVFGVDKYNPNSENFSLFSFDSKRKIDLSKLSKLEEYFSTIASLIQNNQNITSKLGGINFKDFFGTDLVKEDFIWSSVTDNSGRLWFGTLGGGIRVFEKGKERKDMHLTKQNGLISNIILSIAVDGNNNIWLGTEQGVTKITTQNSKPKTQNFSTLDGLGLGPVWDITTDDKGNIWFTTQSGIFKYTGD